MRCLSSLLHSAPDRSASEAYLSPRNRLLPFNKNLGCARGMHVFELSLSREALVPLFVSEHLGELVSFRSSLSLFACSARREGRETVKQLAAVSVCCSVRRALQDPTRPHLPLHPLAQRQR